MIFKFYAMNEIYSTSKSHPYNFQCWSKYCQYKHIKKFPKSKKSSYYERQKQTIVKEEKISMMTNIVKRLQTKMKKAIKKGKNRLVKALCNYVNFFPYNLTYSIVLYLHLFDQLYIVLILSGVDWTPNFWTQVETNLTH